MAGLEKDKIIELLEAKVKNLTIIEGIRSDQVIELNQIIDKLKAQHSKEIKRLKRAIFIHKVVFVAGIVATIYIFSL